MCHLDVECDTSVKHSRCLSGQCACQAYYAQFNKTTCLQSSLLGYDCITEEQCSMKVAHSSCLDGACRCREGYLQYRRHTCLAGARLGSVCYSHSHCRMSNAATKCDFLIPNLFGRCQCESPARREGDLCVVDGADTSEELEISAITSNQTFGSSPNLSIKDTTETKYKESLNNNELPEDKSEESNSLSEDHPLEQMFIKHSANSLQNDREILATPAPVYNATTTETKKPAMPPKTKAPIQTRAEIGLSSLGSSCFTSDECRLVDPGAACINGVCDCVVIRNETNACSAKNRGCHPGTFQCRSDGKCISWFFVCDGRRNCPDGSDEFCTSKICPKEAFRCERSGVCISRASRCDGTANCPHGEDERSCRATKTQSCPEHTFACSDGQCLPEYEFCNAIIKCKDGSDEIQQVCGHGGTLPLLANSRMLRSYRGSYRFRFRFQGGARDDPVVQETCPLRCGNGRCRSSAIACSGRDGCGDNTDESKCNVCSCPVPEN